MLKEFFPKLHQLAIELINLGQLYFKTNNPEIQDALYDLYRVKRINLEKESYRNRLEIVVFYS